MATVQVEAQLKAASNLSDEGKHQEAYQNYMEALRKILEFLGSKKDPGSVDTSWFQVARDSLDRAEEELALITAIQVPLSDHGEDSQSTESSDPSLSTAASKTSTEEKVQKENRGDVYYRTVLVSPLLESLDATRLQLAKAEALYHNLQVEQQSLVANIDQNFLREMRIALENLKMIRAEITNLQQRIHNHTEEHSTQILSIADSILDNSFKEKPSIKYVRRKKTLLDWTPAAFAQQLTVIHVKLYQRILQVSTGNDPNLFWKSFLQGLVDKKSVEIRRLIDWEHIVQRVILVEFLTAPDSHYIIKCFKFLVQTLRQLHDVYKNFAAACSIVSACQNQWFSEVLLPIILPSLEAKEQDEWAWWSNLVVQKQKSKSPISLFKCYPEYEALFTNMIDHFHDLCDLKAFTQPQYANRQVLVAIPWICPVKELLEDDSGQSHVKDDLVKHFGDSLMYIPQKPRNISQSDKSPAILDLGTVTSGDQNLEHWLVTSFFTTEEMKWAINSSQIVPSATKEICRDDDKVLDEFDSLTVDNISSDIYDSILDQ